MLFEQFAGLIRNQFALMTATGKLFISSIKGDDIWYLYLNSFDEKDNPVFRDPNSSTMNCNNDKHFIRRFGNIVAIDDNNNIITIFDIEDDLIKDTEYYNSVVICREELKKGYIKSVFKIDYSDLVESNYAPCNRNQDIYQIGHKTTNKIYTREEANKFGVVESDKLYVFHHFYAYLPKQYVFLDKSISLATNLSKINTNHELFVKGLNIPLETLKVVLELMDQGSLLRADIYREKVTSFIQIKQEYEEVEGTKEQRINWTWKKFSEVPFAGFANELIGTTCIDLAEGKDINKVCDEYNERVDPANRFKAKTPITQSQIDLAERGIVSLGYEASFDRRFAILNDIDINQRIHTNGSSDKTDSTKGILFSNIKPTTSASSVSTHKKAEFNNIEEVSIETFLDKILPKASQVKLFLDSSFTNNLVTLTTAVNPSIKPMFKWDNNFSWTYNGDLAAKSFISQSVKDKGGNINGVLRGSLLWNESGNDSSDLDIYCKQPDGALICYSSSYRLDNDDKPSSCGGLLDLDNTDPKKKIGVENIFFSSISKLKKGIYRFYVKQYCARNSKSFKFEIDMNGEVFNYEYNSPLDTDDIVNIAQVNFDGKEFTIKHLLKPIEVDQPSKNMWGLDSNKFHKVNLICLSPNYWGENKTGNKHYFFFLDGCYSTEAVKSFHIENLVSELLPYRKVLEHFSNTLKLEPTNKQLAGLGFTDDSKETLIVKVEGSFKRTVRVKF